jgi:hypothetical protein
LVLAQALDQPVDGVGVGVGPVVAAVGALGVADVVAGVVDEDVDVAELLWRYFCARSIISASSSSR